MLFGVAFFPCSRLKNTSAFLSDKTISSSRYDSFIGLHWWILSWSNIRMLDFAYSRKEGRAWLMMYSEESRWNTCSMDCSSVNSRISSKNDWWRTATERRQSKVFIVIQMTSDLSEPPSNIPYSRKNGVLDATTWISMIPASISRWNGKMTVLSIKDGFPVKKGNPRPYSAIQMKPHRFRKNLIVSTGIITLSVPRRWFSMIDRHSSTPHQI